ncbi:MAG: DUF222 domain-containing protein [Actinomycetota bacterium]
MIDRLEGLVAALRDLLSELDPRNLSGVDAVRVVEVCSEGERVCAAGRTLAAGRVQRSPEWSAAGYRTPAQWMAAHTKVTLGQAITTLETARRLESLPMTRGKFVAGRLSEIQAAEIAAAASAHPQSEDSLLEAAESETVASLRDRCREVRASAHSDEDACERIRRGRYLRHWTDPDGAVRLNGRFAPDDGAKLVASVQARAERLQVEARRAGQREPSDAYAADALLGFAAGDQAPRSVVHVEVDRAAFERGRVEPGERCVIRGVGPVPVAVARRMARDGLVKILERDGVEVTRVAHAGRTIAAHLRTALEARDPTCVVPGCDVRTGLEIDHIVPLAEGGPTRLNNLARLCRFHHGEKTHRGWRLGGRPGAWSWTRGSARAPNRSA